MQTNQHLKELLLSHIKGTISETDRETLFISLANDQLAEEWKLLINEVSSEVKMNEPYNELEWEPIIHDILNQQHTTANRTHRVHFLKTSWFRYAAAVVLLVGGAAVGYKILKQDKDGGGKGNSVASAKDIAPGTNRAVLTVGNKTIDLASDKTGIAVNNAITYTDGEKIINAGSLSGGSSSVIPEGNLLQLTTPKGGQYQAVLPDGSKVWLNAASSIKFPSKFTGANREVEITGEAYLEIAKNTKQPFRVKANGTEIQVLGTSFNINAYSDEEVVKTTLIDGSVKVLRDGQTAILKPGQQSRSGSGDRAVKISDADLDKVMAWKNGIFNFNGADLFSVMRQLERWYDIKVLYQGSVSNVIFEGEMYRNANLSDVLEALQKMGVKFRLEGKTLIVSE